MTRADTQRGGRPAAVRDDGRDDGAVGQREPGPDEVEAARVVGVRCGAGALGVVSGFDQHGAGEDGGTREE